MALKNELQRQGDFLFRYRSYLPVSILLLALFLYITQQTTVISIPEQQRKIYELGCFTISVLGFMIRFLCVGYSASNTSGRNTAIGQVAESINQSGFYSIIRHPLYMGNFLIWLGIAAFTQNIWFLIAFGLAYWIYYERIVYAEEAFLIDKYGVAYSAYAKTVPAFIPKRNRWTKPLMKFDWFKVIKQEKTGILNLFLIIFLFRLFQSLYQHNTFQVENYWIAGLAFSIIYYGLIKVYTKYLRKPRPDTLT